MRHEGSTGADTCYFGGTTDRQADLISLANATDIHGSEFDDPSNPIADGGKLDKSIVPATYVSFVDYLDDTQLARFGLHNGASRFQAVIVLLSRGYSMQTLRLYR